MVLVQRLIVDAFNLPFIFVLSPRNPGGCWHVRVRSGRNFLVTIFGVVAGLEADINKQPLESLPLPRGESVLLLTSFR